MRPKARTKDPESSKIAGKKVKPTQAEKVLKALEKYQNCTSLELARKFKLDRYMVARRLSDLENIKKVKKAGSRKCRVNKELAVVWVTKQ